MTTERRPAPTIDSSPGSAGGPGAVGLTLFAAAVMITAGNSSPTRDWRPCSGESSVVAPNDVYELDVSSWGWIHLALAATGAFPLLGTTWARITAIVLASRSAVANFLFIPYYPLWALPIIALDVTVVWALTSLPQQQV